MGLVQKYVSQSNVQGQLLTSFSMDQLSAACSSSSPSRASRGWVLSWCCSMVCSETLLSGNISYADSCTVWLCSTQDICSSSEWVCSGEVLPWQVLSLGFACIRHFVHERDKRTFGVVLDLRMFWIYSLDVRDWLTADRFLKGSPQSWSALLASSVSLLPHSYLIHYLTWSS